MSSDEARSFTLKDQQLVYRLFEQIQEKKRDSIEISLNAFLSSQTELDLKPASVIFTNLFTNLNPSQKISASKTASIENKKPSEFLGNLEDPNPPSPPNPKKLK